METIFNQRKWLMGAVCSFHCQLSIHIQALVQGGVFDRFPGAKIIVGHLGENLPMHIWRADQHAKNWGKWMGGKNEKTYDYYFHNVLFHVWR
jgi:predicted TIM-barrel fold metal-dependent hydrolase